MLTFQTPSDVAGMLADLALTTDRDPHIPEFIRHVHLHVADGLLHGWSTDRFRAAHAVVELASADEIPGRLSIARTDALIVAKALRGSRLTWVEVDDADADGGRVVRFCGTGQTYHCVAAPVDVPNLPRVATEALPVDGATSVAFQPAYLADLAAIAKRRKEPRVTFVTDAGMRSTHVAIGEHYRQWLMPLGAGSTLTAAENALWLPNSWWSA